MHRLRIPPELQGLDLALGVQTWVNGKRRYPAGRSCPLERYFSILEAVRLGAFWVHEELRDDPETIADLLAYTLRTDQDYTDFVLKTARQQVGNSEEWMKKCLLLAWALLQRYNDEAR